MRASHVHTVSIGVASCPEHAASPEELLRAADEALYTAKRAGRNCVVIATPRVSTAEAPPSPTFA